jgi:hypothetical protein
MMDSVDDFPPGTPEPYWYRRLLERVRTVARSIRERVHRVEPGAELPDEADTHTVRRSDTDPDLSIMAGSPEIPLAPSPADAARLLLDLWQRAGGRLTLDEAVAALERAYGGRFLSDGADADRVPDQQTLIQFAALVGPGVIYDSGLRAWTANPGRSGPPVRSDPL